MVTMSDFKAAISRASRDLMEGETKKMDSYTVTFDFTPEELQDFLRGDLRDFEIYRIDGYNDNGSDPLSYMKILRK